MRIFQALVELHLDVGAKQALDFHGPLWREFIASPVNMRLEYGPLLRDLADLCQRHDLKAAAVGQDRPVPADELVQAAELCHFLRTGPQHQMIGVAQNDIGARLFHLVEVESLHRAHRADRHEGRRANVAMQGANRAQPRRAIRLVKGEGKFSHACLRK